MTFRDLFQETVTALSANKARSGLTMLGIIIGIASVIAMVGIGNGAQATISASINSLGSNLLIVLPGAARTGGVQSFRGSAKTLTNDDAAALSRQLQGVVGVAPDLSSRFQVATKQANSNTTVDGVTPVFATVRNVEIDEGVFISDSQQQGLAKVAVLGPTTVSDLFPDGSDPVGQQIRINGIVFTVIGTTVSKGSSGITNQDDMVYIPLGTAQRFLDGSDYVGTISIQAASADAMTQVQDDATNLLLQRHRISDPTNADFNILNQADIVATASSVTGTFTALLAAVAGISLVVGGIGIMNMMLTSVTERTREIGLRKAIGATQKDISNQFLMEALALTLLGGGIGVALGCLIVFAVSATGLLTAVVSVSSVVLAFGVSAVIGIGFGWYPARRAARMNPIEALRFE